MQITPTNVLISLSLKYWESALNAITASLAKHSEAGFFCRTVIVSDFVKSEGSVNRVLLNNLVEACKINGLPIQDTLITRSNNTAQIYFNWKHNGNTQDTGRN